LSLIITNFLQNKMNIFIGNLNYRATEEALHELFSKHGQVASVKVIKDKYTDRAKGFAFVEMDSEAEGNAAISALHETEFMERNIIVSVGRGREDSPRPE